MAVLARDELTVAAAGSRFTRFPAIAAPPVPVEQKSALDGCSGGYKRHAKQQNLVRQQQFFRSKSSSVQHSQTDNSVTGDCYQRLKPVW